jgi:hypothetical protein
MKNIVFIYLNLKDIITLTNRYPFRFVFKIQSIACYLLTNGLFSYQSLLGSVVIGAELGRKDHGSIPELTPEPS